MNKRTGARGERHGNNKLTEDQVRDIFSRADLTRHKVLAREYGVHPTTITNIRCGQRWKHLKLKEDNDE